jgi:signal transduction histidine kinase
MQAAWILFADPEMEGCEGCPDNAAKIGDAGIGEAISTAQGLIAIPLIAATVVVVYRRWRHSSPSERQVLTPVLATGGLAFVFLLAQLTVSAIEISDAAELAAFVAAVAVFACLPFAFLLGLLRSRIGRDEEIRTALTAENAQLTAELRATVEELRASRARIVATGDAERRKIERNLHDGAQQHLVALAVNLRLAKDMLTDDPEGAAEMLDALGDAVKDTIQELRDLAHGIYPPLLMDSGLPEALRAAANRSPLAVSVCADGIDRHPTEVEAAIYFCCLEALQNAAKHAPGAAATVTVVQSDGRLHFEVHDDGPGFDVAAATAGHGYVNMSDRLGAIGGTVEWRSAPGEGATVIGDVPLEVRTG